MSESPRTAHLTTIQTDRDGVDMLAIGNWLQLEMMTAHGSAIVYDLHLGAAQFSVTVPKDGQFPVVTTRVE